MDVDVDKVFHDLGIVFHPAGLEGRATGPDPERPDYGSDAIKRAAAAHVVQQEKDLLGRYDDDGPRWYAEHMTRTPAEDGYQRVAGAGDSCDE